MSCVCHVMLSCLFIESLWSLTGKGLTSWLSFMMFYCVLSLSPCGILRQEWYLFVSIPDLCHPFTFITSMMPYFVLSSSLCLLTGISSGLGCTLGVLLLLRLSQIENMVNR